MNKLSVLKDKAYMRAVFLVAVPMILQQLFNNSMVMINNLMLGQLGETPIAAVTASNRYFVISSFAMIGLVTVATIYFAQYHGANNAKMMAQSFHYSLVSAVFITGLFSLVALLFPQAIARFFSKDDHVISSAVNYIPLIAISFIPQTISYAIAAALRVLGHAKKALYSSMVALTLNIVFNYLFIFGFGFIPALGIYGAALGTMLAKLIEVGLLIFLSTRQDMHLFDDIHQLFHINISLIKAITLKAIPIIINQVAYATGVATIFRYYGLRGENALAALSISSTTADLFFVMFTGMAISTVVMVAKPLGSNELSKAEENASKLIQLSLLFSLIFGLGLFFASYITPHLYNVSDEVKVIASSFIKTQAMLFPVFTINNEIFYIVRAGGDVRSTLIIDSGVIWAINLPVVIFLSYQMNISVVHLYLFGQLTEVIKSLVSIYFYKKKRWLNNFTNSIAEA